MGDVVILPVVTSLDLPPERILEAALSHGMKEVVVIGYGSDGEEYFASSVSDGGSALWHLMRAQKKLLAVPD